MVNLVKSTIYPDDRKKLRDECKILFLEHHPEMKGMKLTDHFMLKKVIEFYIESD